MQRNNIRFLSGTATYTDINYTAYTTGMW